MKLLKTLQADPSDTFVFEKAANPGEWAISGAFMFAHLDPTALTGKARAAFRGGFLGIDSFGWSTLARIVAASEAERAAAVEQLAVRLVARCGAPHLAAARRAAEEEIGFAASLCEHPVGMLIAVSRRHENEVTREAFRTLQKTGRPKPAPVFTALSVDEEKSSADRSRPQGSRPGGPLMESRDFWLSCGHHLLDRGADGGLVVTDEFLKVYLARPEITPPADACKAERTIHGALLDDPRQPIAPRQIAAIADEDARENWQWMISWRDHLVRHATLEAAYLAIVRRGLEFPPSFSISSCS